MLHVEALVDGLGLENVRGEIAKVRILAAMSG